MNDTLAKIVGTLLGILVGLFWTVIGFGVAIYVLWMLFS